MYICMYVCIYIYIYTYIYIAFGLISHITTSTPPLINVFSLIHTYSLWAPSRSHLFQRTQPRDGFVGRVLGRVLANLCHNGRTDRGGLGVVLLVGCLVRLLLLMCSLRAGSGTPGWVFRKRSH